MNSQRTDSILQRVPVILAVTAASYGLPAQAPDHRQAKLAANPVRRTSLRRPALPLGETRVQLLY